MDPNANIERQRRIVAEIHACEDRGHKTQWCACRAAIGELADLVQALDGWLCSGGFLPRTWERAK